MGWVANRVCHRRRPLVEDLRDAGAPSCLGLLPNPIYVGAQLHGCMCQPGVITIGESQAIVRAKQERLRHFSICPIAHDQYPLKDGRCPAGFEAP